MELIKPIKPYLEKRYAVAADRTDLYAYFIERGGSFLRKAGASVLLHPRPSSAPAQARSYVTFLGDQVSIEAVIDFGDHQIFEGVTTYPTIITLRKASRRRAARCRFSRSATACPRTSTRPLSTGATPHAASTARQRLVAVRGRPASAPARQDRRGQEDPWRVYGAPLSASIPA